MRQINSQDSIAIPEGVKVEVKNRKVRVTGPKGVLVKDLSHLKADIRVVGKNVVCELWFGNRKELACVRTIITHIKNMFNGVLKGYIFKIRYVYAHFPINVLVENKGKAVEIRNFLGERRVRRIEMLEGVTAEINTNVKDEIQVTGIDLEKVSQSAASIQQSTLVKNKDIRKFLDGMYVSEKGCIGDDLKKI